MDEPPKSAAGEPPRHLSGGPVPAGWVAPMTTPLERGREIDLAFDYRGNVTIETTDGRRIEGYVFDRRTVGGEPVVRLMPTSGGRLDVRGRDIACIAFTGRDPAAGKSWEAWVSRYVAKKAGSNAGP